ncbi:MAG: hypothetical protein A2901_04150 [Elusimicrobia bacterium RIFCSPLOWO2_01_FULL_54_10]|nr:MAG: hypothetical protein A2901_04150 [Elusimicrobia bacterium RIFCSPLOWO2_01_FULL_54_10]
MKKHKKVILIAEDDSVIRELLTSMLTNAGYDLVTTTDGIEAVEAYKVYGNKVHLIITDIGMPRMNGLEAIAVIRKMSESVPIMILSIWEEADYIKIAKQVGVKEYMKKPFDIQEFISNVRGIIPETPSEKSAA